MRHSFIGICFYSVRWQRLGRCPQQDRPTGLKQGAWAKTYKNGKTMYEGEFKDNQPVGIFKGITRLASCSRCRPIRRPNRSSVVFYDTDGKTVTSQGDFVGKLKTGEWKYFDKGKLVLTELYKDGKRNGIAKSYKNDTVIEEIPYVNDLLEE